MIEKMIEKDEKRRQMARKADQSACFHKKSYINMYIRKLYVRGKEGTYRKGQKYGLIA